MKSNKKSLYLTIKEFSEMGLFNISERSIRRWCKNKTIPSKIIGGRYFIPRSFLKKLEASKEDVWNFNT